MSQPGGEPQPDADLPTGPAAGGLRGMYQQAKADPRVQQAAQDVSAAHPQGEFAGGPRVAAGGLAAGYRLGRDNPGMFGGPQQSAPTHWGAVEDASTHGTVTNGDGGPELATSEDVAGLHSRFDELSGQVGNMASSGAGGQAQGNANLQGLTPSRMPPRPASVTPLAASAEQRTNALNSMQQAGQQLASTRASTVAHFAARQAQGSQVTPSGSGNAASDSMNDVTMSGALGRGGNASLTPPSGLGSSASTWDRKRFLQ
jgi:hypothetical protein